MKSIIMHQIVSRNRGRIDRFSLVLWLMAFTLFWVSCKKAEPKWDAEILTPLLKSELTVSDLVQDSSLVTDSSNVLQFVYRQSLYNIAVDSLFQINDTVRARTFTIDSLSLYNATATYPITLGAICLQAGFIGAIIISQNGSSIAIPAIPSFNTPAFEINADSLFTSMTLDQGKIDVGFKNDLPIDITDVKFELRNQSDNSLIVSGNFPLIKSKTAEKQTFLLDGKTLEGKLKAQLISFSSPGSNNVPVLIDTSNAIVAELKVYDLYPNTATAVWPEQNLVNQQQNFYLRGLNVQLKEAIIKSGKIRLRMFSTIQDSVKLTYTIPGGTKNGVPFEIYQVLPPAPPGGASEYQNDFDFSGYHVDFTGQNKDSFNAIFNTYLMKIDYSGVKKTFSKSDNFRLELGFVGIKPEYARGYLSMDTFKIGPSSITTDVFNDLNGVIKFEDVKMSVGLENNIGADAELYLSQITAVNSRTKTRLDLTGDILSKPLSIDRAKDNNGFPPVIPALHNFYLQKNNSNINEFVSLLPDQLDYSLEIRTNPNGNISNFRDFIYDGKLLNIDLLLEAPLNFSASGMQLCRDLEMDLSQERIEQIQGGNLYLNVDNGVPIDCKLSLALIHPMDGTTIDLITGNQVIQAAEIDATGKVTQQKSSVVKIELTRKLIDEILRTKKVRVCALFDTKPSDNAIKIYSDYKINFSLTGDFIYRAE